MMRIAPKKFSEFTFRILKLLFNFKTTLFSALISLTLIFVDAFLSFPRWQSNNLVPSVINGIPLKSLLLPLRQIL